MFKQFAFKKLIGLLLVFAFLFISTAHVTARQDTPAAGQLRLIQMVLPEADVWLDGEIIWPGLQYVITSDTLAVEPGVHTLALAPAGSTEPIAEIEIEVEADHHYTVATMGEYETNTPHLEVIDETTVLADYQDTESNAIIIQNGLGAPSVDVFFVDSLVIEGLDFGEYGVAAAPLGFFMAGATMAGEPDTLLFEAEYFAVPGTTAIAYLTGSFPEIHRNFFTTTQDHMADYLTAHAELEASRMKTLVDALAQAGLLEMLNSGEYTLFAPTNAAFEALEAEILNTDDPAALAQLLGEHIVTDYFSPGELAGQHTLTSLNGTPIEVAYTPGETFTVNGTANLVLQHRVGNGIVYLIDGVLVP